MTKSCINVVQNTVVSNKKTMDVYLLPDLINFQDWVALVQSDMYARGCLRKPHISFEQANIHGDPWNDKDSLGICCHKITEEVKVNGKDTVFFASILWNAQWYIYDKASWQYELGWGFAFAFPRKIVGTEILYSWRKKVFIYFSFSPFSLAFSL